MDWIALSIIGVVFVAGMVASHWAVRRRIPVTNRRAPFVSSTLTIAGAWCGISILLALVSLVRPFSSNGSAVMSVAVTWPFPVTESLTHVDGRVDDIWQMAFAFAIDALPAEVHDILSNGGWTIDYAPIGFALVILAFASLFQYGSRLQRDTEGLV